MLPNVAQLLIDLTPEEYRGLWPTNRPLGESIFLPDAYWQNLPRYLIARCPVCGSEYQENLDTYSLFGWVKGAMGECVYRENNNLKITRCHHFVRVQHFINLNGIEPRELRYKGFASEVPHVMLPLLPDDVASWAVMHALPICRVEGEMFAPVYTVYMLTYYAAENDVEVLLDRLRQSTPGWEFFYPPPRKDGELWWDLNHWVKEGRLLWLAPDHPDLLLQRGSDAVFPYGDIQGRREPYYASYRAGQQT